MKIRYFDFGLAEGAELSHAAQFLPTLTSDFEIYGFDACKIYADYCLDRYSGKNIKIFHKAICSEHKKVIKLFHSPNFVGHSIYDTEVAPVV